MKSGRSANEVLLALGIEHLRAALGYARRGRGAFFTEKDPLVAVAVESELRKAFESLNRSAGILDGKPVLTQGPDWRDPPDTDSRLRRGRQRTSMVRGHH